MNATQLIELEAQPRQSGEAMPPPARSGRLIRAAPALARRCDGSLCRGLGLRMALLDHESLWGIHRRRRCEGQLDDHRPESKWLFARRACPRQPGGQGGPSPRQDFQPFFEISLGPAGRSIGSIAPRLQAPFGQFTPGAYGSGSWLYGYGSRLCGRVTEPLDLVE